MLSRRTLLRAALLGTGASLLAGCSASNLSDDGTSRLTARPRRGAGPSQGSSTSAPEPLGVNPGSRDALLYVPPTLPAGGPSWFVLCLHGAGSSAEGGLRHLLPMADKAGLVLLAPSSQGSTWDAVGGRYGADVSTIDHAMQVAFERVPVPPDSIAVEGFSDGASYALGLGLANGDLFSRVIAFSPGFVPPGPRVGRPAVFISHGSDDGVLPIDRTSRQIVPDLRADGYAVTYREFDGGHTVPAPVAEAATHWLRSGVARK